MRNTSKVPHEVSGDTGEDKGPWMIDTKGATSGHSKSLNYLNPQNLSLKKSPSTPKAHYNGSHATLPPLPSLPEDIAKVVFTHQGVLQGGNVNKVDLSYDRLEFLGDAYIELIATRLVFPRFPHFPVGRLSQQRELLVKNETLAEYSLAYGFDQRLQLANSLRERENVKPKTWTKVMGDVMEAYVAAIIISDPENGFQIAETWMHALWENKFAAQQPVETQVVDSDNKVALSRKVMGRGIKLEYREEKPPTVKKEEGKMWFHIAAFLTGWDFENVRLGGGTGLSKQDAGQDAAADALDRDLTKRIEGIKRDHDRKVREKREREERETAATVAGGEIGLNDRSNEIVGGAREEDGKINEGPNDGESASKSDKARP